MKNVTTNSDLNTKYLKCAHADISHPIVKKLWYVGNILIKAGIDPIPHDSISDYRVYVLPDIEPTIYREEFE